MLVVGNSVFRSVPFLYSKKGFTMTITTKAKWALISHLSRATAPAGIRKAIREHGLDGLTLLQIRREQLARFRQWRADLADREPETRKLPVWLLRARYRAHYGNRPSDWRNSLPADQATGKIVNLPDIRRIVNQFIAGQIGRISFSGVTYNQTAHCWDVSISTYTSGGGWGRSRRTDTRVTIHYGAVLSPDGKTIFLLIGKKWRKCPVWRNHYLFDGKRCAITPESSDSGISYQTRLRATCKRLVRAGFRARMVRQFQSDITSGIAINRRNEPGALPVCLIDLPDGTAYHIESRSWFLNRSDWRDCLAEVLKTRIDENRQTARQRKIQSLIDAGKTVFVTLADSLNSGNCEPGTREFCRRNGIDTETIGAVRSDIILKMERSAYTERAVFAAFIRSPIYRELQEAN